MSVFDHVVSEKNFFVALFIISDITVLFSPLASIDMSPDDIFIEQVMEL